jgi:hypothetical protein
MADPPHRTAQQNERTAIDDHESRHPTGSGCTSQCAGCTRRTIDDRRHRHDADAISFLTLVVGALAGLSSVCIGVQDVAKWVAYYIKARINAYKPTAEKPFVLGLVRRRARSRSEFRSARALSWHTRNLAHRLWCCHASVRSQLDHHRLARTSISSGDTQLDCTSDRTFDTVPAPCGTLLIRRRALCLLARS